ncbi:hypothetical protein [Halobacillus litoralis]|uniref:Uncharacterized protein n=1 Tax=Halobacillus litoralis TaxID=45668 RepID=A0A410ME59_9BACI|nr:hypothetical protein [Halobacillus litoralis]QAS52987.1 hypothetical protein HLI_12690 [Halobacillus litoralis]
MEIFMFIVLFAPFLLIGYFAYKSSGYQKGNIVFHLDEWYKDYDKYVKAIEIELHRRGKEAKYNGNYHFEIDGKIYILHPQVVTTARVPSQRTVLKPKND